MRVPDVIRRRDVRSALALLALTPVLAAFTCHDDNDSNCRRKGNNPWVFWEMDVSIQAPERCPVLIAYRGETRLLHAYVDGPSDAIQDRLQVWLLPDSVPEDQVQLATYGWYYVNPFYLQTQPYEDVPLGIERPGGRNKDAVNLAVIVPYDVAIGTVELTRKIGIVTAVAGPGYVLPPGSGATVSASTTVKPAGSPYSLRWDVNGNVDPSQTGASYSLGSLAPGMHHVRVVATRSDGYADTSSHPVRVYLTASILGPSSVQSGAGCLYQAQTNAVLQPVQFEWSSGGQVLGYDQFQRFYGPGELLVKVTDGGGNMMTGQLWVTVSQYAPECLDQ